MLGCHWGVVDEVLPAELRCRGSEPRVRHPYRLLAAPETDVFAGFPRLSVGFRWFSIGFVDVQVSPDFVQSVLGAQELVGRP